MTVAASTYGVENGDLPTQVYRTLKHMILAGELKSGEKLRQDELAQRLGVSRTPLLYAFSKLEKEMLVERTPHRGARVKRYGLEDLLDIFEVRVRLEPFGAALAATNATDGEVEALLEYSNEFTALASTGDVRLGELDYEFHMCVVKMSGNRHLYNIISSYGVISMANLQGLLQDPTVSADSHEAICRAIRARDAEDARHQMFYHIETVRRLLESKVRNEETRRVDE